jgi:hypothetical protein
VLRLEISDPPAEATATLWIDGTVCTFSGRLNDAYDGIMACPDRRGVPMMLSLQLAGTSGASDHPAQ